MFYCGVCSRRESVCARGPLRRVRAVRRCRARRVFRPTTAASASARRQREDSDRWKTFFNILKVSCVRHTYIGVYKEWATDVTEADARASGVRWVERPRPPSSDAAARLALRTDRAEVGTWFGLILDDDARGARRTGEPLVAVGAALLTLRPRVTAATERLAASVGDDAATARLFGSSVERALFALDSADVAIGFAIRSDDARETLSRRLDVVEQLKTAELEFDTLLRFVDVLFD